MSVGYQIMILKITLFQRDDVKVKYCKLPPFAILTTVLVSYPIHPLLSNCFEIVFCLLRYRTRKPTQFT